MAACRLLSFAIASVSIAVLAGTAVVLSAPFGAATPVSFASPAPTPPAMGSTVDRSRPSAAAALRAGAAEREDPPTF